MKAVVHSRSPLRENHKMRWIGVIYPRPTSEDQIEQVAGALNDAFGIHALIHAEIRPEQGRTKVYLAFVDQVTKGPDPATGSLAVMGVEPVDRYEFTEAQGLELEATLIGDICKYGGTSRCLCEFPCGFCWKKSFASSKRAASADGWDPRMEFRSSDKKRGFVCETCKHQFTMRLGGISGSNSWCPYCCNQKRCSDPACGHCRAKSFASHSMAIYAVGEWPREVALNSGAEQDFKCPTCLHTFEMRPNDVVSGKWCPYCGRSKRCPASKNCGWCLERSFAAVKLPGKFLSPGEAGDYPPFSSIIGIFECQNRHVFPQMISTVTQGTWCQECRDTTEHKVGAFLREVYGTRCKDQPKAPCPDGQVLRLDWRIEVRPGIFVSIELDGEQHFKNCQYFRGTDLAVVRARDIYKMLFCLARGDFVIRISQPDAYRLEHTYPHQWRQDLWSAIENRPRPIQYITYGRVGLWSHLDEEVAGWPIMSGVVEAWFAANSHRLKSTVPHPDPSAAGPGSEDGGINDDDVEATRLALERAVLVEAGEDPAACNCGRTKGRGRPHNPTCPARLANQVAAARRAENRRQRMEALSSPPVFGTGRSLAGHGHTMGTEVCPLDADQQEYWATLSIEILTFLKTVPDGLEEEAITILSCVFDLPESFLWELLELERSM
jgi:hypothetical protein